MAGLIALPTNLRVRAASRARDRFPGRFCKSKLITSSSSRPVSIQILCSLSRKKDTSTNTVMAVTTRHVCRPQNAIIPSLAASMTSDYCRARPVSPKLARSHRNLGGDMCTRGMSRFGTTVSFREYSTAPSLLHNINHPRISETDDYWKSPMKDC